MYLFLVFVYLFLAVLGLHYCAGFPVVAASGGYSLAAGHGLLLGMVSLIVAHGLWGAQASVVEV